MVRLFFLRLIMFAADPASHTKRVQVNPAVMIEINTDILYVPNTKEAG